MAESMKELVEKLRKQKEISQAQSKPAQDPAPKEEEDVIFEEEEEQVEEEKPKPKLPQKPVPMPMRNFAEEEEEKPAQEDLTMKVAERISQLQDNGIYRFERLQVEIERNNILKEISQSLKKISP